MTTRAMVVVTMRGIAMAIRVASNEEGEGGKAMVTATRVASKQRQQQRQPRGQ